MRTNLLEAYGKQLNVAEAYVAKNFDGKRISSNTKLTTAVLLDNTNNINNKQRLIYDYQTMTIDNLSYIRSQLSENDKELIAMYDSIINTLTIIVNEMTEELEDSNREER